MLSEGCGSRKTFSRLVETDIDREMYARQAGRFHGRGGLGAPNVPGPRHVYAMMRLHL